MLEVLQLYKSFKPQRAKPVLNRISLTLQKGDFCVVIGSNGSGKSTLLKTLLGEYKCDKGKIFLAKKNITRLPIHKRAKKISCVFQDVLRGTLSEMTVAENLSLAFMRERSAFFKTGHKNQILFQKRLALLKMGLENKLNSLCGALSGGQRQAIAFVMATLGSPDLLLLDEHCSALDPKSSSHIMEITAELICHFNLTTLMVTHNLRDAVKYGNRLIMLHEGKIVFDVSGEAKKNMTTDCLLDLFHQHQDQLLKGEKRAR